MENAKRNRLDIALILLVSVSLTLVALLLLFDWQELTRHVNATVEMSFAVTFVAAAAVLAAALVLRRRMAVLKTQSEHLSAREARYRSLIEGHSDIIVRCSLDGRLTFVNSVFERIFRTRSAVVIGKPFDTAVLQSEMSAELLSALHEPPYRKSFEQLVETSNGPCWISWEASAIMDGDGKAIEIQSVGRDITEFKKAMDGLLAARDEAEAANRTKSMFLATMSHEIRTPMNGVLGMINLLLDTPMTDEQRSYAKTVETSGRALLSLIDELLDLSKIEAGRVDIKHNEICLADLVESVTELLAPRAHAKAIEIACFIDPELPVSIASDESRLRQILLNLAGNAVKFTEKGGVSIEVEGTRIGSKRDGTRWNLRFRVRDTGVGIEPGRIDRIFEAFTQIENGHARRFGGTGLGLTISRRLVELLGGRLEVEYSVPGQGSSFVFEIPVTAMVLVPPKVGDGLRGRNVTVLMPPGPQLATLCRYLRAFGAEVEEITEPERAVGFMQGLGQEDAGPHPDKVLISSVFADLTTVYRPRNRDAGEDTSLWLLLQAEERRQLQGMMAQGFKGYLVKPLRMNSLIRWLCADELPDRLAGTIEQHGGPIPVVGYRKDRALSILLAEDNDVNVMLTTVALGRAGHRVEHVDAGDKAVDFFRRCLEEDWDASDLPDVMLMDIQMPGMDGIEATRLIREIEQRYAERTGYSVRIPIVALTANATEEDRRVCLEAGMDDLLGKPFDPASLERVVERLSARAA